MEKINVVVVDSDVEVTNSITRYFEVRGCTKIVKVLKDGLEAKNYILNNSNEFDVVIMDMILPNVDGVSLLESMKLNKIDKKIIVLSSYINQEIVTKANSLGTNFFMLKPFSLESLEDRINDLFNVRLIDSNMSANIEVEISELLHNLGVPSHIRGYQYIRDGILQLYNKNSYVNYITKEVYPEIAMKFDTTPSRVERAMRHAIELSWDRGDLVLMEDLFGHSVDFERARPTNSEYITTIADRLKLKRKIAA